MAHSRPTPRIKTKSRRNDLIDMMIDAMRNEDVAVGKKEEETEDQFDIDSKLAYTRKTNNLSGDKEFDEISIIATALVILVAGYDTTAQTMSYMAYELVKNPDIQRRLQEEIDSAFEDAGGRTPDYGVIQNLPYLDQVIHETLRLHPAVGIITRACTEEYNLQTPGFGSGTIKIPQNMEVHMNVSGMHKDPKHYPNPDTFNPDNFSKESKATRHPYSFLGFGTGPRSCLGMRFALLEAKVAVVDMLSKFTFVRSERTPDVIEIDPRSQLGAPKQMIFVRAERR